MTGRDCSWAAELMDQRRELYSAYSPVFRRPAGAATVLHTEFLAL